MKENRLWVVLSAVFAVITAIFIGLTVMNLVSKPQATEVEAKVNYSLSEGAVTDALWQNLANVLSNEQKKVKYPKDILEELKPAYAVNNNLVGWLSIPGTELDTSILQSNDNTKYLTIDFFERRTGETSSTNYGNLFLDYRCKTDGDLSKNMVIHGHTTGRSDGIPKQVFRSLYDFQKKERFIECPLIKYSTLYGTHTYKICAVFYSSTIPSHDNGQFFNYIYPDMSDNNMVGFIEQVNQRRLYDTGVSFEPTDKVITLSTCIYVYGKSIDTRLVVMGRLLREGESEEIDASLVKDNPDYRRPQIWYNSKSKTNPYKNAAKWEPSPQ